MNDYDQYRQPFGREYTRKYRRPVGWVLLMGAIEKVGFPTALLIMLILRLWEPLAVTYEAKVQILRFEEFLPVGGS